MQSLKRQREGDGKIPVAGEESDHKRTRSNDDEALLLFDSPATADASTTSCRILSVEEMICVPLDLLFRQATPPHHLSQQRSTTQTQQSDNTDATTCSRPLLSRAEAQCFLRVRLLAQKLDSLVATSSEALERRFHCRQWTHHLQTVHDRRALSPSLLPLFTLLHTIGVHGPSQTLHLIEEELEEVLSDLSKVAKFLRQFGEQNWAVFESFQDSLGPAVYMAVEKRRLSDLQEECCNRIEALLKKEALPTTTMEEYCQTLWNSTGTGTDISQQHFTDVTSQRPALSSLSQSSRKPEDPSSPEEKENSQQQRHKVLMDTAASPGVAGSPSASQEARTSAAQMLASLTSTSIATNVMSSSRGRDT